MTGAGERAYRLALLAYPAAFRRDYGAEMSRTLQDLKNHGGASRWRLAAHVAADVVLTAPAMRLESLMSRPTAVTGLLIVALFCGLAFVGQVVGSPVFLAVLVAGVGVVTILSRRHGRPIVSDRRPGAPWQRRLTAGLAALAVGTVILIADGGELSEPAWAVWALSWTAGIVLVLSAFVTGVSQRSV